MIWRLCFFPFSLSLTGISRSVSMLILLSLSLDLVIKSSLVDLGYLFCLVELGRLIWVLIKLGGSLFFLKWVFYSFFSWFFEHFHVFCVYIWFNLSIIWVNGCIFFPPFSKICVFNGKVQLKLVYFNFNGTFDKVPADYFIFSFLGVFVDDLRVIDLIFSAGSSWKVPARLFCVIFRWKIYFSLYGWGI